MSRGGLETKTSMVKPKILTIGPSASSCKYIQNLLFKIYPNNPPLIF